MVRLPYISSLRNSRPKKEEPRNIEGAAVAASSPKIEEFKDIPPIAQHCVASVQR